MTEVYSEVCGAHQSGLKLHFRIKMIGYYWPTMVKDCLDYAKKYKSCQLHSPTSWSFDAEAVLLKYVKKETVVNFILVNIIFHIAFLAVNGLVEAFNKTLCNLLKKVVSKSKRDWHEKIIEALWAYRTTHRTTTQATPYSLVYGVEAVLPLKSQIPSLRIAIQGLIVKDNARFRLEELEALDDKRLEA
ncbi:hypothetical protein Sango_2082300 [Sesamum angolense]|uniref:Integrase zinc-binding domain-containing protein n=1 Tax=Sesamum angolense TaxID=2727404 RepID=A0AAE1WBA0_9LAMI|nr:hypothetical protein Sango_2082300 [Sesamum angolense]